MFADARPAHNKKVRDPTSSEHRKFLPGLLFLFSCGQTQPPHRRQESPPRPRRHTTLRFLADRSCLSLSQLTPEKVFHRARWFITNVVTNTVNSDKYSASFFRSSFRSNSTLRFSTASISLRTMGRGIAVHAAMWSASALRFLRKNAPAGSEVFCRFDALKMAVRSLSRFTSGSETCSVVWR